MLISGELDAVIHADLIEPYVNGHPAIGRLFDDYKAEEERYYKKTGIFPIMHVMGVKKEVVEANPWVPISLYKAFDKAKDIAMKRMFNPRIVPLAWYRHALKADWASPAEVKREFGTASILKDGRVVFNLAGNKYRLVVWVNYPYRVVYVRFIGTHSQYDRIDAQTI